MVNISINLIVNISYNSECNRVSTGEKNSIYAVHTFGYSMNKTVPWLLWIYIHYFYTIYFSNTKKQSSPTNVKMPHKEIQDNPFFFGFVIDIVNNMCVCVYKRDNRNITRMKWIRFFCFCFVLLMFAITQTFLLK